MELSRSFGWVFCPRLASPHCGDISIEDVLLSKKGGNTDYLWRGVEFSSDGACWSKY